MIPALQKKYNPEPIPDLEKLNECERLKIDIIKKAFTREEYLRLCSEKEEDHLPGIGE